MINITPAIMTARSIPIRDGNKKQSEKVAYHDAVHFLGTENIYIIVSSTDDYIHYLATSAEEFRKALVTETGEAAYLDRKQKYGCRLATRLPGNEGHTEDTDCIDISVDDGTALYLSTKSTSISLTSGELADLERLALENTRNTEQLYQVPVDGKYPEWKSMNAIELERVRQFNVATGAAGIIANVVAAGMIIFGVFTSASIHLNETEIDRRKLQIQNQFGRELKSVTTSASAISVLKEHNRFFEMLIENNAKPKKFQVKDGKLIWEAEIPSVIPGDQLQKYGPVQVTVTKANKGKQVRVAKLERVLK